MKCVAVTTLSVALAACGAGHVAAPTQKQAEEPALATGAPAGEGASSEAAAAPSEPPPPLPPAPPLVIEAESGELGAEFERQSADGLGYIGIKSMGAGDKPGSIERGPNSWAAPMADPRR